VSELLPSVQAEDVRDGLLNYLTTTFALADPEAQESLHEFLSEPADGIFKGPYVRLRSPFQAATEGWQRSLELSLTFTPYGHQARAFERLSSANLSHEKSRPLPTLVTTGTGSGKTEAFLFPILDHVLRAKRNGEGGIKALILYPMNALANDQARRLTDIITGSAEFGGVRAALYTGQSGPKRSSVTADGLITERSAIRADPPDILLTNYKMLDQLLLRTADQGLWQKSATSLRYIVLDEFHTYDGAQGTDVSMLLRRLGLALKRDWPTSHPLIDDAARERPLGLATPVATSATMGDEGDPDAMISFAETVFGETFDESAVVTETRLSIEEWGGPGAGRIAELGLQVEPVDNVVVGRIARELEGLRSASGHDQIVVVLRALFSGWTPLTDDLLERDDESLLLWLTQAHPFVRQLAIESTTARSLGNLADAVLPPGLSARETYQQREIVRRQFIVGVFGALSHVRFVAGRVALSVDVHLWMRALTRIDRVAGPGVQFRWNDDGVVDSTVNDDPFSAEGRPQFPAVYCRHCGRSGWGVLLTPTGSELASEEKDIRREHAAGESRFRALLFAPTEADHALGFDSSGDVRAVEGLHWFKVRERSVSQSRPTNDSADVSGGWVLPVLVLHGENADDDSRDDTCPSCERVDGIRFLGSAVATMLSVAITTIFGNHKLDGAEKKALVFTDSVQDAAHRAGFVQSRSHVFSLRNAIRRAIGNYPIALDALVEQLLRQAGDDRFDRYRLLAPDVADHDNFVAFWQSPTARAIPSAVMRRVRQRLLLDVELEFGLQSRVGRTLELTGSVAAEVDAGTASKLEAIGRAALVGFTREAELGEIEPAELFDDTVVRWTRGVLERMRDRGAIEHDWFSKYIDNDGNRWYVWGGRPRGVGMPAFPKGRDAPGYPRVGGAVSAGKDSQQTQLDVVGSSQSWFATWARKVLKVTPSDGAKLTRKLLEEFQKAGVLTSRAIGATGAIAYQLSPSIVTVSPVSEDALVAGEHLLVCDICKNPITGTAQVISQLADGPCTAPRCPGSVRRQRGVDNYYRRLYNDGDMRRVVAREHTSLLDDAERLEFENGFKASVEEPDAPNVLVATPTLEMGIDIGDLSTVMLAGLPRSVSSYLQRVGRAGRLTGNSLSLAFVTGRGEQLPKLGDPLSVINGQVRPPATYLNAEEILQRQYFAYLIDCAAATLSSPPTRARDVLKSAEPHSFLGDIIADAEANASQRLQEFLGTFNTLSTATVEHLRAWAMPGESPGESGLAATGYRAAQKWSTEIDLLKYRRKAIEDSLEQLKAAAERTAASEDDKADYRSAIASGKLIKRLLKELRDEPWVSSLERFGVLPNYTLLDDSVRLDVTLSWIDPDSGEFQNEGVSYERGAGVAISELAPGAVFYARGAEIAIDAIDLGVDGEAVRAWAYCASCGYGHDLALSAAPTQCPRCGGKAIADAAQRLNVVELEHVSAEIRRDESSINDRRDERERTRFTVFPSVDINPTDVTSQWFTERSGFGVKYCRDLTIRWLNVGKSGGYGQPRFFSGEERATPLFRVCKECGKLDTSSNANSRREHRPWCRYRTAKTESVAAIALSRTLSTQGVVLRLPPQLTIGDSLAVPSLCAAILLGLREIIGGDPDHLNIVSTVDPVLSDGGDNISSLLIHDSVPGGTGYLSELADPDQIREMFLRAWEIVRDCVCKTEGRAACHRCLLPFAPGGNVDLVSRVSAENSLRRLLDVDEDGVARPWVIVAAPPPAADKGVVFEHYFRDVFIQRTKTLGAAVKQIPGIWGNTVQVTIPGAKRLWTLRPQVPLGHTVPDFVLEQHGGGGMPIAIYTDGFAFHASVAHNRIADDAAKRRAVRDMGYLVMAISWPDVERAAADAVEPTPTWFVKEVAAKFTAELGISLSSLDHITANPLTQLMEWMQDPEGAAERWTTIARALPLLTLQPSSVFVELGDESLVDASERALQNGPLDASVDSGAWQLAEGRMAMTTRLVNTSGKTETALMLDDRESALQKQGFADSWRLWLKLSNLLMDAATIVALSESGGITESSIVGTVPQLDDVDWQALLNQASQEEREVLIALSAAGAPRPHLGPEIGDGIPVSLAWSDHMVTASAGLSEEDIAELVAAGWTVTEMTADSILAALSGK
jgi:ATP-dependent helicase YprA (DUF1998 family)